MTWKHGVAAVLFAGASAVAAVAQAQGGATYVAQPSVRWMLQVIRDGQQIDAFEGTTTVGQARTDTHHHVVAHDVGCLQHPAGDIDLARTLTVSPIAASPAGVTLAIDAQETLEGQTPERTPQGCQLPPQPRQVSASHPGLRVPAGQAVIWQVIEHDPSLAYRVSATLAPPSAGAEIATPPAPAPGAPSSAQ